MTRRRSWKSRAYIILAAMLLVMGAMFASLWLVARGSLPDLSGSHAINGLEARASINRDALGVATISAKSQSDAFRALGFVHAQERFFEMDLLRRTATGELAALLGPAALKSDIRNRPHFFRLRAAKTLARISDGQRTALAAYTQGVNAGLDALDARPWQYHLLRQTPKRWTERDTLLVGYAMFLNLQDASGERELGLAAMRQALPPAAFQLISRDGTKWDAPLIGSPRGNAELPSASELDLRKLSSPIWPLPQKLDARGEPGSNSFAVGGALSGSGAGLLGNDMHSALRVPGLWFRARLIYPAANGITDASGFTLPGMPSIIAGSNGNVAWGFTNSYVKTVEWQPAEYCGSDLSACRQKTETIHVRGDRPHRLDVIIGQDGPVRHVADRKPVELRWLAHRQDALNLTFIEMHEAKTTAGALAIAAKSGLPTGNLIAVDRTGDIGWTLAGPVARSAQAGPDRPMLIDPQSARLWTANNRVYDDKWLGQLGDGGFALGSRAFQIKERLFYKDRFDEKDLLDIQLDDHAPVIGQWRHLLSREAERSPRGSALRQIFEAADDWTGRAEVQSRAYSITREWRLAAHARILDGLMGTGQPALGKDFTLPRLPQFEGAAYQLADTQPVHLLSRRYPTWNALLEDAAKEVGNTLLAKPQRDWGWGQRNTARICHPLASALPVIGKRLLCMSADPLAGDVGVPRVQAPSFGATQRMVVAPSREKHGIIHMPGGQSGHFLSPFFGAGHKDWVEGRPSPFLPGKAIYRLVLLPQKRTPR